MPLPAATLGFAVALAATFAAWHAGEGTLSIHTIHTRRRESLYWAAILMTFALGTAAGDLMAGRLALGYGPSALVFGVATGAIALAHNGFRAKAVLAFWLVYILTQPLGASLGDRLSKPVDAGGLGTVATSGWFLAVIVGLVAVLTAQAHGKDRLAQAGAR